MIQDIFPHSFDNHFRPDRHPEAQNIIFLFSGEQVLCRTEEDGTAVFPRVRDLPADAEPVYLFDLDGQPCFLAPEGRTQAPEGFGFVPLRSLRRKRCSQKPQVFAAITARHLNDWYRSNRFCGRCGSAVRHADRERALICPDCGKVLYPRINPAVIVGVTNGDRLLLTKYAGRNMPFYALVAGFTEIGESFEETVRREVMEEAGLQVTNIRYYKSQPWGFSGDILAGYFCDVAGPSEIHMDAHELKEAVWMLREEVPGQPDDFSLTNEMMLAFRSGKV